MDLASKRFKTNALIYLMISVILSLSSALWAASPLVRVDQIGYLTNETKYGMVVSAAATGAFDVRRVSDNVSVFTGTLAAAFADTASGDSIRTADFSSLTTTGSYYLDVAGVGTSYNFDIGSGVFASTFVMAARAFYGQRCGTAVDMGTVDGVHYSHAICHASGAPTDLPSTYHTSSGLTGTKNTAKGWHDAGDFGKYVVNSGISTGELLWTYEWYPAQIGAVNLNIPESGNATPDILDEARWNLEWMLTMQDSDGGVWHKNTSLGFGAGFPLPENDAAGTRYIIGTGPGTGTAPYKTSCSTADFAAVMAVAARVFQPFDAAFAAACGTAAAKAYTWVTANPNVTYTQPTGVTTGGYGDNNCSDERLWAAAELFRTTGTAAYSTYVVANAGASPLFSATAIQGWPSVKNLALWTYYYAAGADAALKTRILNDTTTTATTIANRTNGAANGYKVSLTGYNWGSNGDTANYGIFLQVANRMSANAAYVNAAMNNLHYLLGRNTHNVSFVTHVGDNPFQHPHHRPSGSPQYSAGAPWPGLLSGGPNSSSTDGSGLDALPANPPAKRWIDQTASYASNEIAINWQAPLVFLLASSMQTPNGTPTPTPTFFFTQTRTPTATPSRTPTNSPTVTLTTTRTSTATNSPSNSPTRTSTFTPTRTPSPTPSFTPTKTSTRTPTLTPTFTPFNLATFTPTSTNSPSSTPSNSPTRSATPTPSRTPTFTATRTSTTSPTSSPTRTLTPTVTNTPLAATATNSPSSTPSNSPSRTPTASLTSTPSSTTTSSRTPTSTATNTLTPSPTLTLTRTPTPSPTATSTFSSTATQSPTVTSTNSASPSPSRTPTASPTKTATASPTATVTESSTDTPLITNTPSNTPTKTATMTPTRTPTQSPTATSTASPTPSPTLTSTKSASPTPTRTLTASPTKTATASPTATVTSTSTDTPLITHTPSNTPTKSPTSTASPTATLSPTNTPSPTLTNSPTFTLTKTFTPTATNSPTFTPTATNTPTRTPTATTTSTSTVVVVTVSNGSNQPGGNTQLSGASNIPLLQFQLSNPGSGTVTMTSLTLTASGTGNDQTGISGLSLYFDSNANGLVDGGDSLLGNAVFGSDNGSAVFNFTNNLSPAGTSTYLVVYNFSGTAPAGTYSAGISLSTSLSGTNSSGPVFFSGTPLNGAVVTIAVATATPSLTPTLTPTVTVTLTPSNSPTFTPSSVDISFSPAYPNPSEGGLPVLIDLQAPGPALVHWSVFTTAFRKINSGVLSFAGTGQFQWDLRDKRGDRAARGLYYIRLEVNGDFGKASKIFKVLVL